MEWADLITLDLSLYDQPGGKEELVKQLEHAVRHVGFFYWRISIPVRRKLIDSSL